MSARVFPQALRVVQISDCHLGRREGDVLLGMDTDRSLDIVVRQLEGVGQPLDLLVVSGDVSSDGQVDAYRRLLRRTAGLARHSVWLPGNHDDAVEMRNVVGDELMPAVLQLGGWQFVFLNSAVPGQVAGALSQGELDKLEAALQVPLPTLVFMHHHSIPVGSAWLDEQRVANAGQLFALLANQPQVKALVCGHVHQESDQIQEGVRQISAPSSCIQFAPNSVDFALDTRNPGYRCFALNVDGSLTTGVKRVVGDFKVDRLARGY